MKNIRTFNFFTVVALITLIIIRFTNNNPNSWISCLNYIGLVIAVFGFLFEFSSRYSGNKVANFIKGIVIIVIALLIVFGCLIVTETIKIDALANDEILLFTLLISLPTNYYCELLDKIVRKYTKKKEYTYGPR